ncbi:nucleotidyl transferase AbiEii/AbiGii toxin family protein [Candidatus Uhrbacteria bacterium]|nr:nucleotidyl transferase AbiEii/AbiGii toxin family protein [Candidatus Uhrbacteria bacterium]
MFTSCASKKATAVFKQLAKRGISNPFYLADGTALALQIGHRISVDLDFFAQEKFSVKALLRNLSTIDTVEVTFEDPESVSVEIGGAKLSFLHYPYRLLFPLVFWEGYSGLADVRDIACMKIDAISSRGTKRDFVDFYYILKRYTLEEILGFFEKKYQGIHYNQLHIIKSLVYFSDADDETMPKQSEPVSWKHMKKTITEVIRKYQHSI